MSAYAHLRAVALSCARSAQVFARDVGAGLLEVSHHSLATVGLCVVAVAIFMSGKDELRLDIEREALSWLKEREIARTPVIAAIVEQAELKMSEPDAVTRATAADPRSLTRQQAAVANWLSKRYKVAPEPVSRLVQEAWSVGERARLEPTLILAIMAIESSFNPFAQSPVGAQGLMQVMTRIHNDKYEAFGGERAAFDPVTNLRVGVLVLKECIARAGGVEAGLRYYVGAANLESDGGYARKVLAEQDFLKRVASGKAVAWNTPLPTPAPQVLRTQAPTGEGGQGGGDINTPTGTPGSAAETAAQAHDDAHPVRVAYTAR
ncbi:lytic transglycosylase domain-containing protein [Pseudaquabacterium rugosum]|jgi:hypothetical protein|uniref:Lytic transglycosylase domain-containing protein n=1 Tax=Pseudaquabacterium rugosum TaxID=2984194 RepID=A0ABU9BG19_9BURK